MNGHIDSIEFHVPPCVDPATVDVRFQRAAVEFVTEYERVYGVFVTDFSVGRAGIFIGGFEPFRDASEHDE